jgi:hypothetical protein
MILIGLFLLLIGCLCALICAASLVIWLGATVVQGVLTCVGRVLENLNTGRVIVGLLYLIPTGLFLYAIGEGVCLAYSFVTTVVCK